MGEANRRRALAEQQNQLAFKPRVIGFPADNGGQHLFEITADGLVFEVKQIRSNRVRHKPLIAQVHAVARDADAKESGAGRIGTVMRSEPPIAGADVLQPEQLRALMDQIKKDAAELDTKRDLVAKDADDPCFACGFMRSDHVEGGSGCNQFRDGTLEFAE